MTKLGKITWILFPILAVAIVALSVSIFRSIRSEAYRQGYIDALKAYSTPGSSANMPVIPVIVNAVTTQDGKTVVDLCLPEKAQVTWLGETWSMAKEPLFQDSTRFLANGTVVVYFKPRDLCGN